jgi:hypothetical protein
LRSKPYKIRSQNFQIFKLKEGSESAQED